MPPSHPFVERRIGTVRREYLYHVMFWGQRDVERKLALFQSDHNEERGHSSRGGKTPDELAGGTAPIVADLRSLVWRTTLAEGGSSTFRGRREEEFARDTFDDDYSPRRA